MNDYIKKSLLLETISALTPDASNYSDDVEVENQDDFDKSTYLAARDMFDDVMTVIEGATPADVAPVVHGHWAQVIYPTGIEAHECSVCGGETLCSDFGVEQLSDYCPWCGAKMDESEDNTDE